MIPPMMPPRVLVPWRVGGEPARVLLEDGERTVEEVGFIAGAERGSVSLRVTDEVHDAPGGVTAPAGARDTVDAGGWEHDAVTVVTHIHRAPVVGGDHLRGLDDLVEGAVDPRSLKPADPHGVVIQHG